MKSTFSLTAFLLAGFGAAWASPIQISGSSFTVSADYSTWSATPDLYQVPGVSTSNGLDFYVANTLNGLPTDGQSQKAEIRRSLTENAYHVADTEYDFSFEVDLFARHDASRWSNSNSAGNIDFTVSEAMNFTIGGEFNMNPGSPADADYFNVYVWDLGLNQAVYQSYQVSRYTAGERFTVGQTGGDYQNILIQPSNFTLQTGHNYRLGYSTWLQSDPNPIEGASTGFVSFSASADRPLPTSPEAVPEPGTLALFGLGLAGLAFAAGRKRRA